LSPLLLLPLFFVYLKAYDDDALLDKNTSQEKDHKYFKEEDKMT